MRTLPHPGPRPGAVAPARTAALVAGALVAAVLALPALGAAPTAAAAPAQGQCGNTAAKPTITLDRTTVGVDETAVVGVRGSDYLVPPHVCGSDVFGGIYVFFGWVQPGGTWGPSWRTSTSTQGLFGATYSYPGEGGGGETRDDGTGRIRLVSFTPGGESGTSTDFHMDGAGNWSTNLVVRGATYTFTDVRTGATNTVDCTVVQCGVFTVGAHGKPSRTNERFTPIDVVDRSGKAVTPRDPAGGGVGGATAGPGAGAVVGAAGAGSAGPVDGGRGGPGAAGPVGDGGVTGSDSGDDAQPVPDGPSSVGEAPATTADPDPESFSDPGDDPAEVEGAQMAAAVQEFGASGRGGPSTALILAAVGTAAALVAVAAAVLVRRRRAGSPEGAS